MKKIIFAALALVALCGDAKAEGFFDIGYSSVAFSAVRCTTGTVVQLNATRPTGFSAGISGYRLLNQDSSPQSAEVWIGGTSVSTSVFSLDGFGYRLKAGESADIKVAKDYRRAGNPVPIGCKAASSAAVGSLPIVSILWYGN